MKQPSTWHAPPKQFLPRAALCLSHFKWVITLLACSFPTVASSKNLSTSLNFLQIKHAIIAPFTKISGIYKEPRTVWIIEKNIPNPGIMRYRSDRPTTELAFALGDRDAVPKTSVILKNPPKDRMTWHGIAPFRDDLLLLLNGQDMKIATLNKKNNQILNYTDIIVDLVKPPADSRGEPTTLEVRNLRAKFRRAYFRAKSLKVIAESLRPFPTKWTMAGENQESRYLLLTNIESFPVLTLRCPHKELGICIVDRGCFVERPKHILNSRLTDMAVSNERNELLIVEPDEHSLQVFTLDSCFHIAYVRSLNAPKKLKLIHKAYVDDQDDLWLATLFPDDFRNSTLYVWEKKHW